MPDDVRDIQAFYDNNVDQESGRLERHPLERDITWRYLDKYLPPRGKILEIGAATGAYTIPLAKRGYYVAAIDLSPKLIEACRKRVIEEGLEKKVTCLVADARDLSGVGNTLYDAVLIMGPLYHLVEEEDRKAALKGAYQRLKPGGRIFSAFASRYGIWGNVMRNIPQFIERQADLKAVLETGKDADMKYWGGKFRGYFSDITEITPLHEQLGFKTLALAGVEPAGTGADESYSRLESTTRQLWLDLFFTISAEKTVIGASEHLLYVGVKEA